LGVRDQRQLQATNEQWPMNNGTAITIPDLACILQFVYRSIFETKNRNFAKEETGYEKIHSIWNIGSESFRIAFGIVGAGSDRWPGLPGLPG
jgi:hypothetical protein